MVKWFKAKRYGYGWYPATWQGWLITILDIILISLVALNVDPTSSPSNVLIKTALPIIVLALILVYIAYRTGEKPRWRWG